MNHWGLLPVERIKEKTNRVARAFRCPTSNSKNLVECLRRVNVNFLVAEQKNLFVSKKIIVLCTL